MRIKIWQHVRVLTVGILATAIWFNQTANAQAVSAQPPSHVVSPQDLAKATQDATQTREQDMQTLRGALSTEKAQKAIEAAHMNPQEVQNAVAGLSDQDLAQLAARTSKAQSDFAAGSMSDHDLLLILVVVAVVILLIALFH